MSNVCECRGSQTCKHCTPTLEQNSPREYELPSQRVLEDTVKSHAYNDQAKRDALNLIKASRSMLDAGISIRDRRLWDNLFAVLEYLVLTR